MMAAVAPANVEFPGCFLVLAGDFLEDVVMGWWVYLTAENGVYGRKVGADGHDDHGEGEGEKLDDHVSRWGLAFAFM